MQEYFTVAEAAELKGVSAETVRRWLRQGKLRGHRLGGAKSGWRIHRQELFPDEVNIDRKIVELIKNMLDERAMFNQFARDALYLLKKSAKQLLPEESAEIFMARTKAKDPDLTSELWQRRISEQRQTMEKIYHLLEKNYEGCKKQWPEQFSTNNPPI